MMVLAVFNGTHVHHCAYKYKKNILAAPEHETEGNVYKCLRPLKPENQQNIFIHHYCLVREMHLKWQIWLSICLWLSTVWFWVLSSPALRYVPPLLSKQSASGSNTIAALLGEWDCGRQVTNLNGARILGVVQQPDGAAVFPFKIPDAATHESAQHLFQKKKRKKALLPASLGPEQ